MLLVLAASAMPATAGHAIVLDLHRLELYCRECSDYVYLQQFDDAVVVSASGGPQASSSQKQCCTPMISSSIIKCLLTMHHKVSIFRRRLALCFTM